MVVMITLGDKIFLPWFERGEIQYCAYHTEENFEYIKYQYEDNPKPLYGRLNTKTREVMWECPAAIVSVKCFMILFGNVLDCSVRILYNVIKTVAVLAFMTLLFLKDFLCCCENRKSLSEFYGEVKLVLSDFGSRVKKIAWLGLGIELIAIYGIFLEPLKCRARIGLLARKMNDGISVRQSFHRRPWNEAVVFYLAQCFQPYVDDFDALAPRCTLIQNTYNRSCNPKLAKDIENAKLVCSSYPLLCCL